MASFGTSGIDVFGGMDADDVCFALAGNDIAARIAGDDALDLGSGTNAGVTSGA